MSLEDQIYTHAADLRSPKWIAKRLKLCPSQVIELLRLRDREERKASRSRARVDKMISDARRSNLCVKRDAHTREWEPKNPPKGGGRGLHFLPSGISDPDFIEARNTRERAAAGA